MRTTPNKPRRRVYSTGETLPEVTDSFRPFPLGFDSEGEPDEQIRAFAVSIRNRADSPIYVREGVEGDGAKIDRFESFDIWENNGISSVDIRGENGGEDVEVRILEAHNDFQIRDKIDAFVRAISHFLTQNKQETTITETETNFDIGTINDGIDIDSVNTDITISAINDGLTIDSIPNLTVDTITDGIDIDSIPNLTIGTINDGIGVTSIPNLTVDTINDGINVDNGNITVDDITAANASFDGDITGQSDFDLSVRDIEGTPVKRNIYFSGTQNHRYVKYLVSNSDFDGFITAIYVRYFTNSSSKPELDTMGVRLEINGNDVMPREIRSTQNIYRFGRNSSQASIERYDEDIECVFSIEPNVPFKFREGDSVDIVFQSDETDLNNVFQVECTVQYVERRDT